MENKELEKFVPGELDDDALENVSGGTSTAEEQKSEYGQLLKPINIDR